MTSPELSPEQQKQAARIYKRAMWIGFGTYFGAIILLSFFRVLDSSNSVALGIMGGVASGFIRQIAEHQVSRAGLSLERVEKRTIPIAATFNGEPLVVRSEGAARLGRLTLAICFWLALCMVGQTGLISADFYLGGIVFLIGLGMLSLYMMTKPMVLCLDAQGVKAWSSDFKRRRVTWDQVVTVEVQQPFDCMDKPGSKTLVFIGHHDVPLIEIPLAFPVIQPEQVDGFIAQVEAKLHGDKISSA